MIRGFLLWSATMLDKLGFKRHARKVLSLRDRFGAGGVPVHEEEARRV